MISLVILLLITFVVAEDVSPIRKQPTKVRALCHRHSCTSFKISSLLQKELEAMAGKMEAQMNANREKPPSLDDHTLDMTDPGALTVQF